MSKLERLQQAQNLTDLAKLLGFTPAGLSYVLYQIPEAEKYRAFEIAKKSGGCRTINAPVDKLSLLQLRLQALLSDCVTEIVRENPRFWVASHGFRKGKTILSNANAHRKRRYVFNLDIEDFFGSINFGRVRGFFIKDRSFGLTPSVATIIAQIGCHQNMLLQGSPSSPVISNLVANILDARLLKLSKHCRCTYTRYADDLSFSTNERLFPREIATELAGANWAVGARLKEVIESAGFTINPGKTRMSYRRSRQLVTGIVVNEKANIKQEYYRAIRAMCHSLFATGKWYRPTSDSDSEPQKIADLKPLEGMLSHIYFVKARRDRSLEVSKQSNFHSPKAPVEIYRQLLFYKHFVSNKIPTIVMEGVSDIVYIKCALISLADKFPDLYYN